MVIKKSNSSKAINKDFIREILNTKSRFFSILILVALAVAFLSGLRATSPDMKLTGDHYFEQQKLADIQIMSTVGITEEDFDEVLKKDVIKDAEATYVIDAFVSAGATDNVVKVYALPEKEINKVLILDGRMPEAKNECLVDEDSEWKLGIKIGDSIKLTPPDTYDEMFTVRDYTVVGVVRSALYISNTSKGTGSIGSGQIANYFYVPREVFDSDLYTTIFARIVKPEGMMAYTEEYDDYVEDVIDSLEDFGAARANGRYESLVGKVDDAQAELDDAKKDADKKLKDAQKALDDANVTIEDGKKEIADADIKIADAESQLADAQKEVEDGRKELEDAYQELLDAEAEYEKNYKKFLQGRADYYYGASQLEAGKKELDAKAGEVAQGKELINQLKSKGVTDDMITSGKLGPELQDAYAGIQEYEKGIKQYNAGVAALVDGYWSIVDAEKQLEDARKEIDQGWRDYTDGLEELDFAEQEIEQNKKLLEDYKVELADAKDKIAQGEKDYAKGVRDYAKAKKDADKEISDAQAKIDDARDDLSDIKEVKWYIVSRSYNPGYAGLGQDADRMGNLAKVFPLIFFLVAALVCLTTMTRMVEEQRIQIGSMKALGYSTWAISKKYIGYGLFPSLFGSVLGLVIGYLLFPTMIFTAYQIMYEIPNIELYQYTNVSIGCIIAAVACTAVATLAACLATLKENPANLMRPKTPTAGKRVFLEKIGFIWKNLNFIQKVTARNLFRYKKRFWMTVIGIGGCTALLIAAFGLRSSITTILTRQYGALTHYSAQIVVEKDMDEDDRQILEKYLDKEEGIIDYTNLRTTSVTTNTEKSAQTTYLCVMHSEEIPLYLTLYDYQTGEELSIGDDGVYIDQKLSELLGVNVGDTIFIDGDDKAYVSVAGIFEHYTAHFAYMTPAYYKQAFDKEADMNAYYMHFAEETEEFCNTQFENVMNLDGVSGTSRVQDIIETFLDAMDRIDFVVVIVIISAAALALVVLYNLSNINITERIRELATIKVLGFFDNEVSAYVYRENVVLTVLGIVFGIISGHWLHVWLVRTVEIDLMMFGRQTDPKAYLYAAILTVVFSVLANVVAHFKMKKIDMVESLKSAE